MLIDSHAHINYSEKLNTKKIIEEMLDDNLYAICNIGTTVEDSVLSVSLASKNKNIYATVGIHPECANNVKTQDLLEIENLAKDKKVVAIGEIGLDYHYPGYDKEKQKILFTKQIEIAIEYDLPICVHTRDAVEDTYEILKEYADKLKRKGVMHCFSETGEWVEKFISLGFYISFAGNVTFKKSNKEVLRAIPIEKILIETDCPFLSPEPLRGGVNEPKNVVLVAKFIAEYLNIDYNYFVRCVFENTKRVYYKIK